MALYEAFVGVSHEFTKLNSENRKKIIDWVWDILESAKND